jgi:hypothetical protein
LTESLVALWRDLRCLVGDRVDLLSLELHRAGMALQQIVLWTLAAGILAVTAWLALCGAAAWWLLEQGLHGSVVLLLVMLVNGVGSWWALKRAGALAPHIALPATRRHLSFGIDEENRHDGPIAQ